MHAVMPTQVVEDIMSPTNRKILTAAMPQPSNAASDDLIGLAASVRAGDRGGIFPFTEAAVDGRSGHAGLDYISYPRATRLSHRRSLRLP